jgi:hypothetical protein
VPPSEAGEAQLDAPTRVALLPRHIHPAPRTAVPAVGLCRAGGPRRLVVVKRPTAHRVIVQRPREDCVRVPLPAKQRGAGPRARPNFESLKVSKVLKREMEEADRGQISHRFVVGCITRTRSDG